MGVSSTTFKQFKSVLFVPKSVTVTGVHSVEQVLLTNLRSVSGVVLGIKCSKHRSRGAQLSEH